MSATRQRALIAGCGAVGIRLARRLAGQGVEVFALSRSGRGGDGGVRTVRADLGDPVSLSQLPARLDSVFYLPAPDVRTAQAYRRVFVEGVRNLVHALPAPPRRFVFVSSTAVHGEDAGEWIDETTLPAPADFNGEVLLQAERQIRQLLPGAIIARLAGLYGPGRVRMLRRARAGEPGAPRWGNRIHLEDAAAALAHLADAGGEDRLYLVSDGHPARDDQVLAWLRERMGLPDVAVPDGPECGRRIAAGRLLATGFVPAFPDFRAGHAPLIGDERSD
ncbi:MAG TPA: NAD-dependent epimerase/dehydratase family protein [Xanthomonadaceae bacterium]|nr:NAD-dependent epimerase/dehydratase family protein [Xanthomonadaceae bacterium]